jgi:hypothetical protein
VDSGIKSKSEEDLFDPLVTDSHTINTGRNDGGRVVQFGIKGRNYSASRV